MADYIHLSGTTPWRDRAAQCTASATFSIFGDSLPASSAIVLHALENTFIRAPIVAVTLAMRYSSPWILLVGEIGING